MATEEEFQNHTEVLQRYVSMKESVTALWNKIGDLNLDISEHEQVLKALEPMDATRRCYQLVGDVLVEKTVADVIPAVQQTQQKLQEFVQKLLEQHEKAAADLTAFEKKYKIRFKREGEEASSEKASEDKTGSSSQGVLVSPS